MEEKLRRLIEAIPDTDDLGVDARKMLELLLKIRAASITGSVTVHCRQGKIYRTESKAFEDW